MNLKALLFFRLFSKNRLRQLFFLIFIFQFFIFCSKNNVMQISSSNSTYPGDFYIHKEIKINYKNDSYANELVEELSYSYTNGSDALGAPDGFYCQVFSDYSNGIITLDMGNNEQILNGADDDFNVIAGQGFYRIKVGNNLSQPFVVIGTAEGNQSFDLASIGLEEARYIQIEYISGLYVEIDAVDAYYFNWIESEPTETNTSRLAIFSAFNLIPLIILYKRKVEF